MRSSLLVLALVACGNDTTSLDTPLAAARCQTAAIKAKSADQWFACMQRDLLGGMTAAQWSQTPKVRAIGFWEDMARKNAPLETARATDFIVGPANDSRYGDQRATFQLEHDKFEVWRKDGRWLIVDTGL